MDDGRSYWKSTFQRWSLFVPDLNIETKLLYAFEQDNVEQIKELLIHIPDLLKWEDFMGCTILFAAVKHGSINILRHLLSLDETVINVQNAKGETLLLHALFNKDINPNVTFDIVSYLLEQNCDVSLSNKCGCTPLHVAARMGNAKICSMLIEKGADVNAKNQQRDTPLFAAIHGRDVETVCALLYYNASVNEVGMSLRINMTFTRCVYTTRIHVTPFCMAVIHGDIQIAKLLMDYVEFSDEYPERYTLMMLAFQTLLPIVPEILAKYVNCRSPSLDRACDVLLHHYHRFDDSLGWIWGALSLGATVRAEIIAKLYAHKGFCKEIEAIFSSDVPIERDDTSNSIINNLVYNDTIQTHSSLERKFYAPVYDRSVPSLMQLARDKCRKIIFDKHQRGASFKAYNVIMGLDIPKRLKDILVLKVPIYDYSS